MKGKIDGSSTSYLIVELMAASAISIAVLLIFAADRLDGDEIWKGAIVGPLVAFFMRNVHRGKLPGFDRIND